MTSKLYKFRKESQGWLVRPSLQRWICIVQDIFGLCVHRSGNNLTSTVQDGGWFAHKNWFELSGDHTNRARVFFPLKVSFPWTFGQNCPKAQHLHRVSCNISWQWMKFTSLQKRKKRNEIETQFRTGEKFVFCLFSRAKRESSRNAMQLSVVSVSWMNKSDLICPSLYNHCSCDRLQKQISGRHRGGCFQIMHFAAQNIPLEPLSVRLRTFSQTWSESCIGVCLLWTVSVTDFVSVRIQDFSQVVGLVKNLKSEVWQWEGYPTKREGRPQTKSQPPPILLEHGWRRGLDTLAGIWASLIKSWTSVYQRQR